MKTVFDSTHMLRAASALALAIALGSGAFHGTAALDGEVATAADTAEVAAEVVPVTDPARVVGGQDAGFWKRTACVVFATVAPLNPPIGVPVAVGFCLWALLS